MTLTDSKRGDSIYEVKTVVNSKPSKTLKLEQTLWQSSLLLWFNGFFLSVRRFTSSSPRNHYNSFSSSFDF